MGERKHVREPNLTASQWGHLVGWAREFRALCQTKRLPDPGTISEWVRQYDLYTGIDKLKIQINASMMYRVLLVLDAPAQPECGKGLPS